MKLVQANDALSKKLVEQTTNILSLVKTDPDGYSLTATFTDWIDKFKTFHVKDDDVFIVTFPKSGTTWMQEIVWGIINRDYDFSTELAKEDVLKRAPHLDFDAATKSIQLALGMSDEEFVALSSIVQSNWKIIETMPSPRIIKSHLPVPLLPAQIWEKKAKVIYVYRNPLDVLVSMHTLYTQARGYSGTIEDFAEYFIDGTVLFGPQWTHVTQFWEKRNEPNIFFVSYEELQKDLFNNLVQIGKFLNYPMTNAEATILHENVKIDAMKKRDAFRLNQSVALLRRGKTGTWKRDLPKTIQDKIMADLEQKYKDHPFRFCLEI